MFFGENSKMPYKMQRPRCKALCCLLPPTLIFISRINFIVQASPILYGRWEINYLCFQLCSRPMNSCFLYTETQDLVNRDPAGLEWGIFFSPLGLCYLFLVPMTSPWHLWPKGGLFSTRKQRQKAETAGAPSANTCPWVQTLWSGSSFSHIPRDLSGLRVGLLDNSTEGTNCSPKQNNQK